jgi:hypothetical protein
VLIFFVLISFVFWLASLAGKQDWVPRLKENDSKDLGAAA